MAKTQGGILSQLVEHFEWDLIARLETSDQFPPRIEPTPIESFSRVHHNLLDDGARTFRELVPSSTPGEGQQYAFEVDLDRCFSCKSCVTACHSMNGLDPEEVWRSVGLLAGGTETHPVLKTVTSSCHHCLEPACADGCPVNAYTKDSITGIVHHLDDQCIGCQYCVLKCPYGAPQYNKRLGVVRKCDMCSPRLAAGEPPACATACPSQAIRVTIVEEVDVRESCELGEFLPSAATAGYTLPATSYVTTKPLPRNALPGDYHAIRPELTHGPLVAMLVLSQLAVGVGLIGGLFCSSQLNSALAMAIGTFLTGVLAMGASTRHLGRPLYAFRAVLGFRKSWLSREIIAFGGFSAASCALMLAYLLGWQTAPFWVATWVTGVSGVLCSVMVYHDTHRAFWNLSLTGSKFLLTTIGSGASLALVLSAVTSQTPAVGYPTLAWVVVVGVLAKLMIEASLLTHLRDHSQTPLRRSARLLAGQLKGAFLVRLGLGLAGGIALPSLIIVEAAGLDGPLVALTLTSLVLVLAGDFIERHLFFVAVTPPKMPGGIL